MNCTQSGFLDTTNHVSEKREEVVFLKLKPVSDSCRTSERLKHSLIYRIAGKVELHSVERAGKRKNYLNDMKKKHKSENVYNANNNSMDDLLFL